MKLYFMKQDAVNFMKHNMERLYTHYYQDSDNSWIEHEYGSDPFLYFTDVKDFQLTPIESGTIGEVDFNNCKILYENLMMLSESQCADERLWAGLCNSTFYEYIRRRYAYSASKLKDKKNDASAVVSRFFFSGGTRAGCFRNTLAKCWWVGRATYRRDSSNHFEMLDAIGTNDLTTKISDIFYSNTFASNPTITAGICKALKYFSDRGQSLDEKKHVRAAMKYLNTVGGMTLLDVLTEDEISQLVIDYINGVLSGSQNEIIIEPDGEDDDELIDDDEPQSDNANDIHIETNDEALKSEKSTKLPETESSKTVNDKTNFLSMKQHFSLNRNSKSTVTTQAKPENMQRRPEKITYGCWVKVIDEKSGFVHSYKIPLRSDADKEWPLIMVKLLGKNIGYRLYLSGRYFRVVDYGQT